MMDLKQRYRRTELYSYTMNQHLLHCNDAFCLRLAYMRRQNPLGIRNFTQPYVGAIYEKMPYTTAPVELKQSRLELGKESLGF